MVSEHVDTEDENRRSRISLACTRCRTRKDRCDGLKPSCSACRNAEKPCVYEAATRKRGLPEGYVRGLEKLFALATQGIEGLEDALIRFLQHSTIQKSWNSLAADELHAHWKDSRLHQELDLLLSISSTGTKRKREQDDELDDVTILDNVKPFNYRVTSRMPDTSGALLEQFPGSQGGLAEQLSSARGVLPEALESVRQAPDVFPSDSPRLFDLYFTHVHCWFPVVSRPVVLKAYYESRRAPGAPGPPGPRPSIQQALLWAILAYATTLDNSRKHSHETLRCEKLAFDSIPIYNDKLTRVENVESPPVVSQSDHLANSPLHAQALLILALIQLGNDCKLKAWTLVATAKCILLVNRESSATATAKSIHAALQGCEMLISFFHHEFGVTEVTAIGSAIDEDGHEEWETWGQSQGPSFSLSTFNKLCRVVRTVSDTTLTSIEKSHDIRVVEVELLDAGVYPATPTTSPPHHLYVQLMIVYAKFALNTISPSIERQELATQAFNLLESCNSPAIGLEKVPPLIAPVFDLAYNEAHTASRQDLIARGTTLARELSKTWPCFGHHSSDASAVPLQDNSLDNVEVLQNSEGPYFSVPNQAIHVQTDESLSNSVADTFASQSQNQWMQTPPTQISGGTPANQFDASRSPNYSHTSIRNNSFGQINTWANMGNYGQGARSSSFPVPSPSFHGDEIDAIFHEMAHLDTNEWTNERALGLREFGFNDDSAFVEFCNDPERIAMPPITNSLPLSSSRQSWTFAAQPP